MKYLSILFILLMLSFCTISTVQKTNPLIISYIIDPVNENLHFFYQDAAGNNYGSFKNLKAELARNNEKLLFAMNGGMYTKQGKPQGLYIENGQIITPLDTLQNGYGNFYLQPNGVFYLTNNHQAVIATTKKLKQLENIKYATQSGPMLVIDGALHPKFNEGSANVHIRNGVGLLPDGKLLFAMSKEKMNFYDFATFFQENGCKNALYLDGFVSRMYLPAKDWEQMDGNFGVIIGEKE